MLVARSSSEIGQTFAVPLNVFPRRGGDSELLDGYRLVDAPEDFPSPGGEQEFIKLAGLHVGQCAAQVDHWLFWEQQTRRPTEEEVPNLFLLALWLVVPTTAFFHLNFGGTRRVQFILDQFRGWPDGHLETEVTDGQMAEAAGYFRQLLTIPWTEGRIQNCLVLTFGGCIQAHWQVALMCQVAALEGLLIHAKKRDSGDHVAEAFSLLTEFDASARRIARKRVNDLYKVRSDIQHGRVDVHADPKINLANVAKLRDVLWAAWRTILTQPGGMSALDGDDEARSAYFDSRRATARPAEQTGQGNIERQRRR